MNLRTLLLFPGVIFVISRSLLLLLGHLGPGLIHPPRPDAIVLPRTDPLWHAGWWAKGWFRFDAYWFVDVATHGYRWGTTGIANTNFLPVFPALIHLFRPVFAGSAWITAWVIPNLCFLAALVLLWRWALLKWDRERAMRVLLLFTVFPFSFFFVAPYSEAPFLVCAVGAFLFAEQNRWELAAMAAGLSAVTRPVGLAVIIALLVLAVQQRERRRVILVLASFVPLVLFAGYLTAQFGHPLGFLISHDTLGWRVPHGGLLATIQNEFNTRLTPFDRIDAACVALFLASAVAAWRYLGPAYGIYVALGVLLPLIHGLVSMERYVSVLFPAIAIWALPNNKILQISLFALSLLLLTVSTMLFTAGFQIW